MFERFSYWFDLSSSTSSADKPACQKSCDHGGCQEAGIYRAPKSRSQIEAGMNDWYWFCLIHVREYNAQWNYYVNMNEADIERERRADATWQRPSWPMGAFSPSQWSTQQASMGQFQDPFNLFNEPCGQSPSYSKGFFLPGSPEEKSLTLFELSFPFTAPDMQKRYRELVKKHHPDANNGCPQSDETLKRINEAYEVLKRVVNLFQGN